MASPELPQDFHALAERASRGDRAALDLLLVHHLPRLRAFIRLRAGPAIRARESSSDIAQSVCREVLQDIERFQHGGEAGFKHWLYTTALRKLQKRDEHWRTQKREQGREVADEELLIGCYRALSTPSRKAEAREEAQRLEQAFDALNEDDREVITLARVIGLPHRDIAERMGRTEQATRLLLHRALAKLAEKLDDGG